FALAVYWLFDWGRRRPGLAAFVVIRRRSAEVLFEECLQAMLGAGEFVPVRIHGDEFGILVDVPIEHVDEAGEGLMTSDGLEDRIIAGLCHRSFLRCGNLRGRCCGSPGRWAGARARWRLRRWPRPTASAV